jgi:uncharacterized protein (TIGR04222 family)
MSFSASSAERILNFESDIQVHQDASLTVTEAIEVAAESRNIRHGIYRDFPTRYRDRAGNHYRVTFEVLDAQRNGQPETWKTERRANGIRVYLGSASQTIESGRHDYILRYRTTRQIGYFPDYDELYWNVTGNGWEFVIERASATVELPMSVDWRDLRFQAFTGPQGSTEQAVEHDVVSAREVEFRATRALQPKEGLTIALGWPKGLVHEPGPLERGLMFLRDNGAAIVLGLGFFSALAWYLWAWYRHGRDPAAGVIIPRFEPPKGLSPAACRYVRDMALRSDAFTAAVISLAVKGYLTIEEKGDDFILYRQPASGANGATPGELAVREELLPQPESWIELDNENHAVFQRARVELRNALKSEYHGRLFKLNGLYMIPAIVITLGAAALALTQTAGPAVWISYAVLSVGMHLLFLFLMRAPTPAGRRVLDEIEGFAEYLDTAEQSRLDRMRSPALTPQVFESFLPYAFALGVENNWCSRFAREFPREVEAGNAYSHRWYIGNRSGLSALHHMGHGFGTALSGAISSASSPPGSSSGTGGGGFSGGGGGGGGGGGW